MNVDLLMRGDVVEAIHLLDEDVAHIEPGTIGVVFEETNAYKDNCGPMVRWFNKKTTCCNVYTGDIKRLEN
jgi:hypothetical protein